jgi:hypothetical protein
VFSKLPTNVDFASVGSQSVKYLGGIDLSDVYQITFFLLKKFFAGKTLENDISVRKATCLANWHF